MIRDVFNTARGRKYMVPEWTVAQLDRACGCELAAVDERSLGIARAVAAMNGGGLMNSYRHGELLVGQKVAMIDPRPRQDEANGEVYLEFGVVDTIRDIELSVEVSSDTSLTFYEIRNEQCRYLDGYGEAAFFASYFRPVADMFALETVATEVKHGKSRRIKTDQFDRQRIHSSFSAASSPLSMQRDGASSPPRARPAGEASASLASPAHSSRAAAASWPRRLPATFDMDAANSPAVEV